MEFQRWDFGSPYPTPCVKNPEARGISRKLTEAKNGLIPTRIQIFHGVLALGLWYAVPDPLRGQTGSPRKLTEAHGS